MKAVFFATRARKFFESLDPNLYARAVRGLELLGQHGSQLKMPYSRALGGGLFELRIVGIVHIRFMYAFQSGCVWILHVFEKKSAQIMKRDIDYARLQLKMLREHV